ncbi:MAG: hypothetical protein Kow0079_09500 [Vicingaceae bacterium]
MDEFQLLMDNISKKVDALTKSYQLLKADNETLKNQVVQLKNENNTLKEEIKNLTEKNKLLKLSSAVKSTDNKDVKLKINELLREIDKCILQLNK